MIFDRLVLILAITLAIALFSSSGISAKDDGLEENSDHQINVDELESSSRNKIKILLNYPDIDAAPTEYENADHAFKILSENSGKIVDLLITFEIENHDKNKFSMDKAYTIRLVEPVTSFSYENCIDQPNLGGFVDNFLNGYRIGFAHPFNNHETAQLIVGARHNFPLQTISCTQGFNRETPDNTKKFSYSVSGHFSISTIAGTTRNLHLLTPVF